MLSKAFHASRRNLYHDILEPGQMGILVSGEEKRKAGDENYPFSVYRNFYYITGFERPGTIYIAYRVENEVREILFIERPEPIRERFEGKMPRPEEVIEEFGIMTVRYVDELEKSISSIMSWNDIDTVWIDQENKDFNDCVDRYQLLINKLCRCYPWLKVKNSYDAFSKMRKIKEREEIEKHKKACRVTSEGVRFMMKHIKPGVSEGQLEAYFDFVLKSKGCDHAFETIAASGKNACVLHYNANNAITKDGDLILFDLGASSGYYCADVSRTYPVNGKFTDRQRQLYEIVLKGLDAALALAKPGQNKDELQKVSRDVMAKELIRIGMIEKPEEISKYYLHGSGHFIGLYTHDVGEDSQNCLVENMMFTLEPGLYFPEENIGIRIEDTLLVTKDGCEVLTADIPKTIEEIEAFMEA